MQKRANKAQSAMEFFLTYGWAILIVTILVAALVHMNVFNPEQMLPEKCIIKTDSGLFCQDFNVIAGTGIILRIKNVLETKSITINSIDATFKKDDSDVTCTHSGDTLEAEEIKDFTIGEGCTLESGDKIKADLVINYIIEGKGFNRTTTGTFMKVVP